jgi:hypothetical protein
MISVQAKFGVENPVRSDSARLEPDCQIGYYQLIIYYNINIVNHKTNYFSLAFGLKNIFILREQEKEFQYLLYSYSQPNMSIEHELTIP